MEDKDVATLLVNDMEAHIALLQVGGFVCTIVLALIGIVLAMRAYAVLSEARALYWQASALTSPLMTGDSARAERALRINAPSKAKKLKSNAKRGVI